MRSPTLSLLAPALLLPLALVTPARAHQFEVGGFVGAHISSESDELGRPELDIRSPNNSPQHTGLVGLGLAYLPHPRLAIEGEVLAVPGVTRDSNTTLVSLHYRGHLLVHILTGRLRPFLLVGGGAASSVYTSNEDQLRRDTDLYIHGGLGLKYDVTDRFTLRLDGKVLFPPRIDDNLFTQNYQVQLGFFGRFGGKPTPKPLPPIVEKILDRDGDGIMDLQDKCPDQAEDRDGFQDEDGCPDPDNDGDGVLDKDDRCPLEAGVADNGGCADTDKDKDGVVDRLDQCPDVAGVAEFKGCQPPDTDKDGVIDSEDKCPAVAGLKALGGCPDKDGDGIPDAKDKCPDKAETKNGFEDDDGCPDELPKAMAKFTGVIKGINFKTGKDEIMKPSFKLLDKAVAVLKEFPSIHMEISGHTDNVGDPAANKALSQKRAEAVTRYFIEKGITKDRLVPKGYGEEKPIADNKSKAGKTKNRRVEFAVLSQW